MDNEHDKACACCVTPETVDHARRRLLAGAAGAATVGAVAMATGSATAATEEARALYADPEFASEVLKMMQAAGWQDPT